MASESHKNDLIDNLDIKSQKIKVAYLGYDSNLNFSIDTGDFRLENKYWIFIFIFRPYKNLDGLLNAYAKLCKLNNGNLPDLVVIGDYPHGYLNIDHHKKSRYYYQTLTLKIRFIS